FAIENGVQQRVSIEQFVLVGVIVIQPPIRLMRRLPVGEPVVEVVFDFRAVGSTKNEIVVDLLSDRVPSVARDDVSKERSSRGDLTVRVEPPAEWIVQLSPGVPCAILRVRRVVKLGKIALVHLFGRHSNEARAARAKVRALVVAKEE